MDGYITGTLIVNGGYVGMLLEDGSEKELNNAHHIEVRNSCGAYEYVTYCQVEKAVSTDGWVLYAGLYARIK
jgi:hypothetical protein